MRINLIAFGTRGDVQPALAFACGLRDAGHEVVIFCGANFVPWVESYGFTTHPARHGRDDEHRGRGRVVGAGDESTGSASCDAQAAAFAQRRYDTITEAHGGDCDLLVSGSSRHLSRR
ncbi:MAG: hypothetical protein HND48_10830 [Chloroflexi bacterium]|nr:hypothetical protein [Chloroflexota bacterium]